MLIVSEMLVRSALMRTESRGAHYRSDYPKTDQINWLSNIIIKNQNQHMVLEKLPVLITKWNPPG
jgi:succinate dehydrogenase/fumarate reductase flavoprotein subunit